MRVFINNLQRKSNIHHHLTFSIKSFYSINNINSSKDYYKTLGLSNASNAAEIKKNFYQLAKKYHPDVNKGNEEKFKEINEAYEVLSDESKRKEYDELRKISVSEGNYKPQQQQQNSGYNPYNSYNSYNNNNYGNNEQRYYYYEVKTDKNTYKKSFKQEGPFNGHHNNNNKMGLNEEILQEFMKTFYGNKMHRNGNAQQNYQNYQNTQNARNYQNQQNKYYYANQGDNDEFLKQQGFRNYSGFDYEDYKAYESRKEEELRREREFEKLQREKQVFF